MSKPKVLIVEDESIIAKDIENSLKKMHYNIVGIASDLNNALLLVKQRGPDIILMDIMLKGDKTGIEAAKKINKENNIPIVYLTAYADTPTLNKAKKTIPYGYILKPFKDTILQATIETALLRHNRSIELKKERDLFNEIAQKNNPETDHIFIKSKSKKIRMSTKDILWVEALKDYIIINTSTTRHTIHSTMKEFELKLPVCQFIRVHRSFIVRTDNILSVEYSFLSLVCDSKRKIPVGGAYKDQLIKRLKFS